MNMTFVVLSLVPLLGGAVTVFVVAGIAQHWLFAHTSYQRSRVALAFLGPLITSFGTMRSYTRERRERQLSTGLTTAYWVGLASWLAGFVLLGLVVALFRR